MMSQISASNQFTENKIFGIIAEIIAILDYQSVGYQIRRTGIGSDFIAFNEFEEIFVEVKYGNAQLSSLQRKQKTLAKKNKIAFQEYRVTQKHLEYFIEENKINLDKINPDELRESIYDFKIKNSENNSKIVLPWVCPHCKNTKAIIFSELIEKFGLRKMSNGTIRNQSWCRSCR